MTARPHVVLAFEWMPRYRHEFYAELLPRLEADGIDVTVLAGQPPASRSARGDAKLPGFVTAIENRFVHVAGRELTWQPVFGRLARADLAIVQHETGLLVNYPTLLAGRVSSLRTAVWGHGEHPVPGEELGSAETVKRWAGRLAHHVFAYTERSRSVYENAGYDPERITVVQNSRSAVVPTADLVGTSDDVRALVERLRRTNGPVGWMASALDESKRLPFLVQTIDEMRRLRSDFEMIVLGDGADRGILDAAAESRPWLHVLGPRFGVDKAVVAGVADILLQPGLIGLHVIDAFAAGTPMVTTDFAAHSHEIDYLDSGNSLMVDRRATPFDLAAAAIELLDDDERMRKLRHGCALAAETYSLGAMVERFRTGVHAALS